MKRYLLLLLTAVTVFFSMEAVSTACCMLKHDGKITTYYADEIQKALDNSLDGDTIFLSDGEFPGFTVTKKVTVRGKGTSTKTTGNVYINIPNNPVLESTVLEGLYIPYSVRLETSMSDIKIKQCKIRYFGSTSSTENKNVIIDRCSIGGYYDNSYFSSTFVNITSMTVNNSYLYIALDEMKNNCQYINCDIDVSFINNCRGNFINCILKGKDWNGGNKKYINCTFEYCGFIGSYTDTGSCPTSNCKTDSSLTDFPTKSTLETKKWFGNDGTVMGYDGGTTPYTLTLSIPKISKNEITYDKDSKTLKVDLKVSAK